MTKLLDPDSPFRSGLRFSRRLFRLLLVYSLIWFVLAGSDPASWIIGIPAVLLAVAVSIFLSPGSSFACKPLSILLFMPHFIILSVLSGIDVMRRTFSLVPRINPGIFSYRTSLEGSARILLTNVISLQPGTLSADLKGDEILIHVLDREMPLQSNIRNLELRIARIFPQQSGGREKT
ncbi:MAG: Na+/H+ antiporter subunit E [Desulfobulbaceae bacterium]|nr:Na+/H+ antiporter subunit E [Desulfobulbaceae bacterium]